jgi:hypothetical protein
MTSMWMNTTRAPIFVREWYHHSDLWFNQTRRFDFASDCAGLSLIAVMNMDEFHLLTQKRNAPVERQRFDIQKDKLVLIRFKYILVKLTANYARTILLIVYHIFSSERMVDNYQTKAWGSSKKTTWSSLLLRFRIISRISTNHLLPFEQAVTMIDFDTHGMIR